MFKKSNEWIVKYANSSKATFLLSAIAFAESSFFPFPPDPLYIAMILANKKKKWNLVAICTISSVVGGFLGYYIGYFFYHSFGEWIIEAYNLQNSFIKFQNSFNKWGFWIITLKGLTPIPFKLVTIAGGVAKINLWEFAFASILARGFRFLSIMLLLQYCGAKVRILIQENITLVTFGIFIILIGGFFLVKIL